MNTFSDSFCVILIVGAGAAAADFVAVDDYDWGGTAGGVVAAADTVDAAADTDGHAVATYHRTSSYRICRVIFIDQFFFFLRGFWFSVLFSNNCSLLLTPSQFINTLLFDFQLN